MLNVICVLMLLVSLALSAQFGSLLAALYSCRKHKSHLNLRENMQLFPALYARAADFLGDWVYRPSVVCYFFAVLILVTGIIAPLFLGTGPALFGAVFNLGVIALVFIILTWTFDRFS